MSSRPSRCIVTRYAVNDSDGTNEIRKRSRPISKWNYLVGCEIAVFLDENLIRTGVLEELTPSGEIGWIAADGVEGRSIVDKSVGHRLWKLPPSPNE